VQALRRQGKRNTDYRGKIHSGGSISGKNLLTERKTRGQSYIRVGME